MRVDVLAIGTELLLGQIVDSNTAWLGEQLAAVGIDTFRSVRIGDNHDRMVQELRAMAEQADALICCGGLGPTQDDCTRSALADAMGVPLVRRQELVAHIESLFAGRGRPMPDSNLLQADVPDGAAVIPNPLGTAPGIQGDVTRSDGSKIPIYALPGVPYEMHEMFTASVLPDLLGRQGERRVIVSRTLKTWGTSESGLAESIADIVDAQTNPTIAFLARGIEGIQVRLTASAPDVDGALRFIEPVQVEIEDRLGPLVYAHDDETMESQVLALLSERGWKVAVAESLTGGLVCSRLVGVPGAGRAFVGGMVTYATEIKRGALGVTATDVISDECVLQMAEGIRAGMDVEVGIAVSGVAGPDRQDGHPVGEVHFGIVTPHGSVAYSRLMPGDRERIRSFSAITLLDTLRRTLSDLSTPNA
ncbi:MAG: competence/damage-inducible protein A [Acidimicrobiia bacterium]|nr:competence/damage-inducible protein A [Acidimicrobiia bacterium]MBP8179418.1 competence/damage-inducible protein A [Acidimicrobiia bacterium]